MSRKLVAVVIGATLILGVVGVGAGPAGAQPTGTLPTSPQPSSLDGLVDQIEQVCSDASALADAAPVAPRLTAACDQLPALKLLVDQVNEMCSAFGTAPIAGPKICYKIDAYRN